MSNYIIGALIGIMIYSFILTIVTLYKDNSGYFIVSTLDIIMAGPFGWFLLFIINFILRPIYCLIFKEKNKEYKHKNKSQSCIKRVVKNIVKNYSKKKYHNDYFNLNEWFDDYYGDYKGYESLVVKKARNEWLNNKFIMLMKYQKEETLEELKKYFIVVNETIMKNDKCDEYYIKKYKDKGLYKLKCQETNANK